MLDIKKWQGGRIRGGKLGLKSMDKTINEHKYIIFILLVPRFRQHCPELVSLPSLRKTGPGCSLCKGILRVDLMPILLCLCLRIFTSISQAWWLDNLCLDKRCTGSRRSSSPSSHTPCSLCLTTGDPGEWNRLLVSSSDLAQSSNKGRVINDVIFSGGYLNPPPPRGAKTGVAG